MKSVVYASKVARRIAHLLGVDRRTPAGRWRRTEALASSQTFIFSRPWRHARRRWASGGQVGQQLWRELQQQGYTESRVTIARRACR